MSNHTYSFTDLQAAISGPGGAFSIGSDAGCAEEGLTFEYVDEKDTMTIGAGGTVMHSLHASKAGKATLRLLKTSLVNQQLNQLYNSQTTTSTLHGQNVITAKDTARGDTITCTQVAFAKHPSVTYSKDGPLLEWTFNVGKLNIELGSGSPSYS